ncbi:MAG: hypothetical protein MUE67_11400 [Anaerolineales bacterium]|nr:hypothetical protein [Anaerolineales bacterium]
MAVTLRNQRQPSRILNLTHTAWFGILELADLYGWTPIGSLVFDDWQDLEIPLDGYDYELSAFGSPDEPADLGRLVILEDALNLADALDQAFFEYEPLRVPPSYYLFEPASELLRNRPSIGAIAEVIEFCRLGAFWVEPYRRQAS